MSDHRLTPISMKCVDCGLVLLDPPFKADRQCRGSFGSRHDWAHLPRTGDIERQRCINCGVERERKRSHWSTVPPCTDHIAPTVQPAKPLESGPAALTTPLMKPRLASAFPSTPRGRRRA